MGCIQECVIPTDFIYSLLGEGHPTIVSPAEKALMQTAIAQRHTTSINPTTSPDPWPLTYSLT